MQSSRVLRLLGRREHEAPCRRALSMRVRPGARAIAEFGDPHDGCASAEVESAERTGWRSGRIPESASVRQSVAARLSQRSPLGIDGPNTQALAALRRPRGSRTGKPGLVDNFKYS